MEPTNNNFSELYNKIKYNLMGCRTLNDSLFILKRYNLSEKENDFIMSIINGKNFDNNNNSVLDMDIIKKYCIELNNCNYKEDAQTLLDKITTHLTDKIQIRTLSRIVQLKPSRKMKYDKYYDKYSKYKQNILDKDKDKDDDKDIEKNEFDNVNNNYNKYDKYNMCENIKISKKCPHCNHTNYANIDKNYIICGYNSDGFDWIGCQRDWCFMCEKLLCKRWEEDHLFLPLNNIHDNKCCKKRAIKMNKKYPDDFCSCNNAYICRNMIQ